MIGRDEINRISDEKDIPLNWKPGQVIAELYRVDGTTFGGMGMVYPDRQLPISGLGLQGL